MQPETKRKSPDLIAWEEGPTAPGAASVEMISLLAAQTKGALVDFLLWRGGLAREIAVGLASRHLEEALPRALAATLACISSQHSFLESTARARESIRHLAALVSRRNADFSPNPDQTH